MSVTNPDVRIVPMSSVPGYNSLAVGAGAVSYPATYQGVKKGSSSPGSGVSVPQGNVTFRAQPGARSVSTNSPLSACLQMPVVVAADR